MNQQQPSTSVVSYANRRPLTVLTPPVHAGVGNALRRAYSHDVASGSGELDALLAQLR